MTSRQAPFLLLVGLSLVLPGCGGGGGGGGGVASGGLVPSFGTDGQVDSNPSALSEDPFVLALSATHMFVGGFDKAAGASDDQWRLEKRSLATGLPDPDFGPGGAVTSNPGAGDDWILAIALDASAVYVGGWDTGPGDLRWRVEKRDATTGALVAPFGALGVVTSNPSAGADSLHALLVQGGRLYLAGNDNSLGNTAWRIECRNATTGALDPAFGVGGVVVSDPSPAYDTASALATDGTSLYVAGRDQVGGDWRIRVEKRSLVSGALDAAFGTGGVAASNPSPGFDSAKDVAYAGGFLYLAGTDEGTGAGDRQFRIEKRSAGSGALDAGFGAGGAVTQDLSLDDDELDCIAVDGGSLYVGGTDRVPGDYRWHVQKRSTVDGTLVKTFGANGVVTGPATPYYDEVYDLAVDATYLYLVGPSGEGVAPGEGYWRIEKRLK